MLENMVEGCGAMHIANRAEQPGRLEGRKECPGIVSRMGGEGAAPSPGICMYVCMYEYLSMIDRHGDASVCRITGWRHSR
jgi:hypothetical protein